MKKNPLQKGKNISTLLSANVSYVRDMILEHYDDSEPPGTLVFNWPFYKWWDDKEAPFEILQDSYIKLYDNLGHEFRLYDLQDLKNKYNKLILLETEHLPFWKMPYMNEDWLDNVDEIWVLWLEAFEFFKNTRHRNKVRWMPIRYCSRVLHIGNSEPYTHNIGFFGCMTPERKRYWDVVLKIDTSSYHIEGIFPKEIPELVSRTKFILDMACHPEGEILWSQNVVRIGEMIASGKSVLIFPSSFNYFEEIIPEMKDPISDLEGLEWKSSGDYSELFKKLTYEDSDFEKYKERCLNRYIEKFGDPYFKESKLNIQIKNPIYEKI